MNAIRDGFVTGVSIVVCIAGLYAGVCAGDYVVEKSGVLYRKAKKKFCTEKQPAA